MKPHRLLSLLTALTAVSCGDTPAAGTEGGPCRSGTGECDDPLVCFQGTCTSPDEAPTVLPGEEDYVVTMSLSKTSLKPDGMDELAIAFDIMDRATGKPTTLAGVFVRTAPQSGQIIPQKVPLDKGHAAVRVRACNDAVEACPPEFRVVLSTQAHPTATIAQSPLLTNVGVHWGQAPDAAPVGTTDAGEGGASGGSGGSAGSGGTGDGGSSAGGAGGTGETPAEARTRLQAMLEGLVADTEDCDAKAAAYQPGMQDLARDLCVLCAGVWRSGGGAFATAHLTDFEATHVQMGPLRDLVVVDSPDLLGFYDLTARGGDLVFSASGGYSTSAVSGCSSPLDVEGGPAWFGVECTSLPYSNCGGFSSAPLDGKPAILWQVDTYMTQCPGLDGGTLVLPASLHVYMCVNTLSL